MSKAENIATTYIKGKLTPRTGHPYTCGNADGSNIFQLTEYRNFGGVVGEPRGERGVNLSGR